MSRKSTRRQAQKRVEAQALPVRESGLDASVLPSYGFSHRSPMWWGTLGAVAIESTVFALAIVSYFYIRNQVDTWPPGVPVPDLVWGTLNTAIMLASFLPNAWTKHAAEDHDLEKTRVGMVVCIVFAAAFLLVRILEFRSLNVSWTTNAYGSIVWLLLGLHTVHLLTDFLDTTVLAVLLHTGPLEGKRFVDVEENAVYWNFVVAAWIPIYAVIYWAPRL